MSQTFDPTSSMVSGYLPLDGTIEFYGRINSILKPTDIVLDLGAGRGAWYFEDRCEKRRLLRDIKPKARRLIGADVDPLVLSNPTTTENLLIENGRNFRNGLFEVSAPYLVRMRDPMSHRGPDGLESLSPLIGGLAWVKGGCRLLTYPKMPRRFRET
jgi:hypothetical protein